MQEVLLIHFPPIHIFYRCNLPVFSLSHQNYILFLPKKPLPLSPVEPFVPVRTPIFIADNNQRVVKQRDGSSENSYHEDLPQGGVENPGTPHRGDAEVPRSRKQTRDADPKIQRG